MADEPDPTTQLQTKIAELERDKSFLLEDSKGLRQINNDLIIEKAEEAVRAAAQQEDRNDAVALILFGVSDVTAQLDDYSRTFQALIRMGLIPPDTKVGEVHQHLLAIELRGIQKALGIADAPADSEQPAAAAEPKDSAQDQPA